MASSPRFRAFSPQTAVDIAVGKQTNRALTRHLERVRIRLEAIEYARCLREGIINREIYQSLRLSLGQRPADAMCFIAAGSVPVAERRAFERAEVKA